VFSCSSLKDENVKIYKSSGQESEFYNVLGKEKDKLVGVLS
jgi:hypothetical protein